jgi:MFS transporter, DHA3 family, macrolide efflux protein
MGNRKAIGLLLSANIVSGFAQGISMLAIPWYFATIAGQPSLFAMIYAGTTLVSIFWNLYAGSLIDRYPRKNIFIGVSSVCGLVLLMVAAAGYLLGHVPLALVGLVFVTTMFNYNIHFGALYAFGQELSSPSEYGKISSYLEIQNQATSVISGGVAALLLTGVEQGKSINIAGLVLDLPFTIAPWTLMDIFLMDGITYIISIILISMIRYTPVEVAHSAPVLTRIREGFGWLRQRPALFSFGIYSFAIFVVLMVEIFLLVPLYVHQHLGRGSDVFASSEIFYSLGAMLAGMFIRRVFHHTGIIQSILIMMVFTVIIFYIVAFSKVTGIFYAFSFLLGITNAGTRVLRTTYLFNHIPNEIIGRTNSVFNVINIIFRGLFILLFSIPWFSESNHVTWAYFICGSFVLLCATGLFYSYKLGYNKA